MTKSDEFSAITALNIDRLSFSICSGCGGFVKEENICPDCQAWSKVGRAINSLKYALAGVGDKGKEACRA